MISGKEILKGCVRMAEEYRIFNRKGYRFVMAPCTERKIRDAFLKVDAEEKEISFRVDKIHGIDVEVHPYCNPDTVYLTADKLPEAPF